MEEHRNVDTAKLFLIASYLHELFWTRTKETSQETSVTTLFFLFSITALPSAVILEHLGM